VLFSRHLATRQLQALPGTLPKDAQQPVLLGVPGDTTKESWFPAGQCPDWTLKLWNPGTKQRVGPGRR